MKLLIAILGVAVCLLVVSGGFAGLNSSVAGRSSGPQLTSSVGQSSISSVGDSSVLQAERSLERGGGPAGGANLECQSQSTEGSISCASSGVEAGSKFAASHPPVSPGTVYLASMANDSKDGYVVLFGGYNYTTDRYENQTWTFKAGIWTNITTPQAPPARYEAMMTFDAADNYVLLFGGVAITGELSDTWKFVGGTWTELQPTEAPSPRESSSMVYDARDGYVLLFGGAGAAGTLGDTWKFVNGEWSQLSPLTSPAAVYGAGIAYDYKDREVVMFGGDDSSGDAVATTWTFSANVWSEVFPTKSPSARWYPMMTYDSKDGYVLLFAGVDANGDTWKFVGGAWTELSPGNPPGERYGSAMAFDSTDGYVLMNGGTQCAANYCGDTWQYSANVWTDLSRGTYPSYRTNFVLTYDAKDNYVLLYGGFGYDDSGNSLYLSDTWTFHNGAWSRLQTSTSPGPRGYGTMAYDATDGYVVFFGGANGNSGTFVVYNDTWKFVGGKWTDLKLKHAPLPRYDAAMTYDAADGYILLYGGIVNSAIASDTWKFVDGAWTELTGIATPAPFYGEALTYDAKDGYVVAYGGLGGVGICNDGVNAYCVLHTTWKFQGGSWTNITSQSKKTPPSLAWGVAFYDSKTKNVVLTSGTEYVSGGTSNFLATWTFSKGSWTEITPVTPPPAAPSGGPVGAVYDAKDGYGLLFGVYSTDVTSGFGYVAQTWMFSNNQWTGISLFYTPPSRFGATMVYDAKDGYVVLFGGFDTEYYGDTWTYASGNWSQVLATVAPPARANASMAYDAEDGYVVLFGGEGPHSPTPTPLDDTWKYVGGTWTQLKPSTHPSARYGAAMTYDAADLYVLLFGGCGTYVCASQLADTWEFVGGTWTNLTSSLIGGVSPPGTTDGAMTYDAKDGYILLFGGYGDLQFLATSWSFVGGKWTDLTSGSAPEGRIYAALVYDAADGTTVLFGGYDNGAYCADTWTYSGGTWTNITSTLSRAPPDRELPAAAFDTASGYVLVFGGLGYNTQDQERTVWGDTWEYHAGEWTQWSVY